jgi:predicted small secreted protein
MKKSRLFALLLCLVTLGTTACGNPTDNSGPDSSVTQSSAAEATTEEDTSLKTNL